MSPKMHDSEDEGSENVHGLTASQGSTPAVGPEIEVDSVLNESKDISHASPSQTHSSRNIEEDLPESFQAAKEMRIQTESQESPALANTVERLNKDYKSLREKIQMCQLRQVLSMGSTKAAKTEPTLSNSDHPAPVAYKIRYKNSKLDAHWDSRTFDERDWERHGIEAIASVLEMRKDTTLSQRAGEGKDLSIANIIDETMTIHSPHLLAIMPEVVGYYPSSKISGKKVLGGHQSITISKPYRMLGGARPKLRQLREKYEKDIDKGACDDVEQSDDFDRKKTTIKHIEHLEYELDKVLKDRIAQEELCYACDPPVASFDMLWLLFRPGSLVCTTINDKMVCCMIMTPFWDTLQVGDEDSPAKTTLELRMWFLDFNSTHVDRRRHALRIDSFAGTRKIIDFEAYPLRYMRDQTLRETWITRGKRYMKLLQQIAPQCRYRGPVFTKQESNKEMKERHFYDGKVVVDPLFHYIEHGPPHSPLGWADKGDIWPSETSDGSMKKFVDINPKSSNLRLEDTHYMLLTPYIRGFTLGTRRWVWFDIDNLEDYKPDRTLIEGLAIDPDSLSFIKAFVPQMDVRQRDDASEKRSLQIDPIEGKGEGQIMLLHGPPGTGKTFTAECLAEYSGRPLLRLSCGELGLDPTRLEVRLWQWFRMAEEWQAVLLIDEADVYLQQRHTGQSLEKETIVAVFLRALEYYRGIMFLTSNAPARFDDGVTSRVSLVHEFKDLEPHERKKLRVKYQEKIRKDKGQRYILYGDADSALEELDNSEYTYNGREIKNVFHTALALATEDARHPDREATDGASEKPLESGKVVLHSYHIKRVMKSMERFIDYQKGQHLGSREKIATEEERRNTHVY